MSYHLPETYISRTSVEQTIELSQTDQNQNCIYAAAKAWCESEGWTKILDLGCGAGFKLMKYFGGPEYVTLGLDLPVHLEYVKRTYPDHLWAEISLDARDKRVREFDLVICSDVIEHIANPDQVLDFIQHAKPKGFIISTPDRDEIAERFRGGPPRNRCHFREWNFKEFQRYIGERFDVLRHYSPLPHECSQLIMGRVR